MTEQERIREDADTTISARTFLERVLAAVKLALSGWQAPVAPPPQPSPPDAVSRAVDRMREHLALVKKRQPKEKS